MNNFASHVEVTFQSSLLVPHLGELLLVSRPIAREKSPPNPISQQRVPSGKNRLFVWQQSDRSPGIFSCPRIYQELPILHVKRCCEFSVTDDGLAAEESKYNVLSSLDGLLGVQRLIVGVIWACQCLIGSVCIYSFRNWI